MLRLNLLPPKLKFPNLFLMKLSKLDGTVDETYVAKTFDTTTQLVPRLEVIPWRAVSHALFYPTHLLLNFAETPALHPYPNAKVAGGLLLETPET